ncbi:MAG TPA: polyprenol monophosphomannose synthase [Bacteroidia bacterium]|nr:polyprenol monophosphomannose synthase [Bacteroidia bacterium]
MSGSLVIIPTYNEKGNIENITRKVFSLQGDFHLLVVDDGSPDGTAAIVKTLMQEFPNRLFILERQGKLGLGTAYITGFKWALEKGYDYIFEMDADFSHNPEDLLRLKAACEQGADVAIGSRYVKGGNVKNWDMKRVLMSYFASFYVRMILWMNIKDTTAGFKCYRRRVLEALPLDNIKFIGYAFQIEMKYLAYKKKFKIVEVPITFIDREVGVSKMSRGIFKEAFLGVIQIRLGKHGK